MASHVHLVHLLQQEAHWYGNGGFGSGRTQIPIGHLTVKPLKIKSDPGPL